MLIHYSPIAMAEQITPGAAVPAGASPSGDAPFGLIWLSSKEEISSDAVVLEAIDDQTFGQTYAATKVPKVLADQQSTFLSFGFDNRLIRIAAIGKSNDNDHYGSSIRARYNDLQRILESKYGKPIKRVDSTDKYYSGDDYAIGLSSNKNFLASMYHATSITISLRGTANGTSTAWVIIFEHDSGMADLEQHKKAKEKETL